MTWLRKTWLRWWTLRGVLHIVFCKTSTKRVPLNKRELYLFTNIIILNSKLNSTQWHNTNGTSCSPPVTVARFDNQCPVTPKDIYFEYPKTNECKSWRAEKSIRTRGKSEPGQESTYLHWLATFLNLQYFQIIISK